MHSAHVRLTTGTGENVPAVFARDNFGSRGGLSRTTTAMYRDGPRERIRLSHVGVVGKVARAPFHPYVKTLRFTTAKRVLRAARKRWAPRAPALIRGTRERQ